MADIKAQAIGRIEAALLRHMSAQTAAQRLMADLAGFNITAASRFLATLAEFEREIPD